VEAAIETAQLADFVAELPHGLATRIGERGVRLSGGQPQRLALARAIYRDKPVLVLDEATSALDDATEEAVLNALDRLQRRGVTIVIIAHRSSTLAGCDLIVRLEAGRTVLA
jgi:ATP-binding cassette subfamily B protein